MKMKHIEVSFDLPSKNSDEDEISKSVYEPAQKRTNVVQKDDTYIIQRESLKPRESRSNRVKAKH